MSPVPCCLRLHERVLRIFTDPSTPGSSSEVRIALLFWPLQKGEHYHLDDGQDAINNVYASGLIEEINIEPEQDMQDPSKINIKVVVEEIKPKSVEVRLASAWATSLVDH